MLSIAEVYSGEGLLQVRALFREYAATPGVDLGIPDFDQEVAELPGRYARPDGRLLLAKWEESAAGCVALRPLEDGACEMKRLYVRPQHRSLGLGLRLVERVIQEARDAHYECMRLDSLPIMQTAINLYRRLGFRDIPPYGDNRVAGAVYLELPLTGRSNAA
jgi:GNAT superfamily N-acetyltransferase